MLILSHALQTSTAGRLDNKMIQYTDIKQGQGLFEFFGDLFIGLAGLGDAGGVVMAKITAAAL